MLRSIKAAAVAVLLSLTSCAHKPQIYKDGLIKQCEVPEHYALSDRLSMEDKILIIEGFEYWNAVAGSTLFTPIGTIHREPGTFTPTGYTLVGYAEDDHPMTKCNYGYQICSYAEVHTNYNNNKCLMWAKMRINKRIWDKVRPEVQMTIARHEVGHILGFSNTYVRGHLMTIPIRTKEKHPIEVSKLELEALLILYPHLELDKGL